MEFIVDEVTRLDKFLTTKLKKRKRDMKL